MGKQLALNIAETPVIFIQGQVLNTKIIMWKQCFIFVQMERLIHMMQDEKSGVLIRTVKGFMSKIPSVFTGDQNKLLWYQMNFNWIFIKHLMNY